MLAADEDDDEDDDGEDEAAGLGVDDVDVVNLLPATPPSTNAAGNAAVTASSTASSVDGAGKDSRRPQLLTVTSGPPAKRARVADDDEEEKALLAGSASPQCTTPDPLMRSIGVGQNLPLEMSTAGLLFGGDVAAPEERPPE